MMATPASQDPDGPNRRWHALDLDDVLRAVGGDPGGLTREEAAARRTRFGSNILPRAKPPGLWRIYVRQFKNPLIYLLIAAAAVSGFIGELIDAAFIFGVLQFNALVGTVQESRAASSAAALDALVKSWTIVRRGGGRERVDSADLVPGDIVELEPGNQVPADIRIIEDVDLAVDQSLLTGESLPVGKGGTAPADARAPVAERANMLFAGTTVLRGRATGAVVAIAASTEIGRIATALAAEETAPPPLVLRLNRFTRTIGLFMVGAIALLAAALALQGVPLQEIFFVAVALAVAAIPEGLPVAITVTLAVGTGRMARRNVIVRALPAVEGLGACTLIASDKTGTLTCNELTVKRLVLPGGGAIDVGGEGYLPEGSVSVAGAAPSDVLDDAAREVVRRLATAGALCNEASLRVGPDGEYHVGDTVDVAFLVLAMKLGLDPEQLRQDAPEYARLPFEPARRYAATFNRDGPGSRPRCFVKGAAEVVLPMCAGIDRPAMLAAADSLAGEGYRVLAVAAGEAPASAPGRPSAENIAGLRFLGFAGLIDPLRPEAPEAVRRCREAGIDVRMVTGDHPATALAIARQLGMPVERENVVTGAELDEAKAATAQVYARVEPMQKLSIVEALRREGHFVAVTGDGVNDAPALRAAHIGVAMGRAGTDVARDAADLILADDNFASIVNGVEEGRVAYDNVRKVIFLLISTGATEIVIFFLALAAGLPLPLFALQLLWLNVVTDSIQVLALAFEKAEPGVLRRKPRPPGQPLFDRRMIEQTAVSGAYMGLVGFLFFDWCLAQGWSEEAARNALLLLMVLFENVHVFNCRSETRSAFRVKLASNPWLLLAVFAAQGAHLLAMYTPGYLNDVLHAGPVDGATWLIVAALALSLVLVMEVYKRVRQQHVG